VYDAISNFHKASIPVLLLSFSLKILLICLDHLLQMMIRRMFSTIVECAELTTDFLPHSPSKIPSTFGVPQLESLNWLYAAAPCFPVAGSKISVINEPKDFYDTLLARSANAKRRIFFTSLYLGTGELEQGLVAAMHQNLRTNKDLSVNILLDFTRGTRGVENSQTTLMPLVRETKNFRLSLYHTPVLRGLTKRLAPPRWNELIGLQHMKIYLFDDTVIVSGANLSKDYFTNRQDRYVMIEDRNLADFYSEMIGKVQEFSMCVGEDGGVRLHESWNMLPYESAHTDFAQEAKDRIWKHYNRTMERQKLIHDEAKGKKRWSL
jgi:CDP-diacylglycerol---glycerol-3-phosphate 3-phosphatidyltransferase